MTRARRVLGSLAIGLIFFLESKCSSGRPLGASSGAVADVVAGYERQRSRAWDPARRFKALFKAEVSPTVGAVGRGYLSVWWDGASGVLTWRTSAPIGGAGRGGILRVKESGGETAVREDGPQLSKRLAAPDLAACILGTPDAPGEAQLPFEETPRGLRLRIDGSKRTALLNGEGKPIELAFPGGEVVTLQPGEGVPRRIEARGRDGRAILTLESYGPWPPSEKIPPL